MARANCLPPLHIITPTLNVHVPRGDLCLRMHMVLFRLWFPLNGVVSGHRGPFELFSHCRWHDVVGRVHKGTRRINKLEHFLQLPS